MDKELDKLINNYAIDIEDDFDVSPFEYINTLNIRSYLEENYDQLTLKQKEKLEKYDSMFLKRADELYKYLLPIKIWGKRNGEPESHWWWHLDKIN